jgi:hypothetical protein
MERSERGRDNFHEGADVGVFEIGRVHDGRFSMRVGSARLRPDLGTTLAAEVAILESCTYLVAEAAVQQKNSLLAQLLKLLSD